MSEATLVNDTALTPALERALGPVEAAAAAVEDVVSRAEWDRAGTCNGRLQAELEALDHVISTTRAELTAAGVNELAVRLETILDRHEAMTRLLQAERDALAARLGDARLAHQATHRYLDVAGE